MGRQRRAVFRNPDLQERFERDGYVIVPLDDPSVISSLWSVYNSRQSGISSGFYSSTHSEDASYKAFVNSRITQLCSPLVGSYLQNYRPIAGNLLVKHPGAQGELPVHQDWTMVDEARFSSVNCWIPMMEIDKRNGPLMVVKGSHRYFETPRGSPFFPSPLDGVREIIRDSYLTELNPEVGETVIHDHRLIHYSPPNWSETPRVAAALGMLPVEADLLHFYRAPDGKIFQFEVDDGFFSKFRIGDCPDYPKSKEVTDFTVPVISPQQFRDLYDGHRSWWQKLKTGLRSGTT